MKSTLSIHRGVVAIGIPLVFLGVLIFLMKSSFLMGNELLDIAVTVDLLFTIPLVYFLLIRKSDIPKTTVIPWMMAGLLVGSYFLPRENQTYITLFKTWALPVIELSILTWVVIKVRTAIKSYSGHKNSTPDFFNALTTTCREILHKKLVFPIATEIAVIYYGFIDWKTRALRENEFTYHQKSGALSLFGGFILILGIETVALHFLLARWSDLAAWILTGLGTYTAMQVFGLARSLSKRPILLDRENENLTLRYGILNEAQIPYSDIQSVDISSRPLEKDALKLSPLGEFEGYNVMICLKKENTLVGFYGIKKKFKVLRFHVDEPHLFKEKIEAALQDL